jgi:cold shock CspA family protein
MTGKIRTLRVDKGFGFIKDDKGNDYFFHQSAIYGEDRDLREATASSPRSGKGRRGHVPRTSGARRPDAAAEPAVFGCLRLGRNSGETRGAAGSARTPSA